jgi:alanine dehydrogenase
VEVCESARAAVVAADLICTVTASREPVVEAGWITPGAHINAVGASLPTARELDSATVRMAKLFTDRRESLLREAGDVLAPLADGSITEDHVQGELAEILAGAVRGRESADDVTLFKSLGLAIEDVAAARHVYERALALGTGVWVSLGGLRPER